LSRRQRDELLAEILAGPETAGYPTACWTAVLIADLIQEQFQVRYHPRYIPHVLDHLGLSDQKAKFRAAGADAEAALLGLEETWPEIIRMAQAKRALVLFGDEARLAQWGTLGYTWDLKGCQPIVTTSGIRKAYRVFGVLDCFGGRFYRRGLEDGKFDSTTDQGFLEWLLTQLAGPILLIQDNAPDHVSAAARRFYADHSDRLTVYQLPPDSPISTRSKDCGRRSKKMRRICAIFASLQTWPRTSSRRSSGMQNYPAN
jgi:hypothetical protein